MSSHPNVILMLVLTPERLARKTMTNILGYQYSRDDLSNIKIGSKDYTPLVMEDDYEEDLQIQAKEGDLVFYDLVTYGYGEVISMEELEKRKTELEIWGKEQCERYNCTLRIEVTANYY